MLSLLPKFSPWPLARLATDVWTQFRFENDAVYDEVTEAELTLFGATSVLNRTVTVTAAPAAANYANINNFIFEADQDFYVRVTFYNSQPPATQVQMPIITQWVSEAGVAAWFLNQRGPAHPTIDTRNKIQFSYKDSDGTIFTALSATSISYAEWHVVEVSRVSGYIRVFVDGIAGDAVYCPKGNAKTYAYPPAMLFRFQGASVATYCSNGARTDIQVVKGQGFYKSTHEVKPLLAYERPVYTEEDANAIVLQLGFRRGSPMCEKFDTVMQMFGTATITRQARLSQTNVTTSYAQLSIPYFGAADFTIEFMFNFSGVQAQYGIGIGNYNGAASHADNKYVVGISAARSVWFRLYTSPSTRHEVATTAGVVNFNQDHHLIVQRRGSNLSIYVDGELKVTSDAFNSPMLPGALSFATHGFNNGNSFGGNIWNIRIADKAMYNGEIKTLPAFPSLPKYTAAVAPDIVAQFRSGLTNENGGSPIQLSGGASVEGDYIVTDRDTGVYEFPCEYFGAADYTVEAKITFLELGASTGHYIFGQYENGSLNSPRNSWNLRIQANRTLHWVERRATSTIATTTVIGGTVFALELNREYHVVAERVGATLSLYVDGNLYSTLTTAAPLTQSPDPVRSEQSTASSNPAFGRCARKIRDIRIAKRALYYGRINKNFKSFALIP